MLTKPLLMVIDMQEKLVSQMNQPEIQEAIVNMQQLIDLFGHKNYPVIVTEQYPRGLGFTVKKIKSSVNFEKAIVSEKLHFDSMKEASIAEIVNRMNTKTVVLTGVESHICIYQSAIGFIERGYETYVVSDAVVSRNPQHKETALAEMSRIGCKVLPAESIAFLLIDRAGCEDFKYMHKLIK